MLLFDRILTHHHFSPSLPMDRYFTSSTAEHRLLWEQSPEMPKGTAQNEKLGEKALPADNESNSTKKRQDIGEKTGRKLDALSSTVFPPKYSSLPPKKEAKGMSYVARSQTLPPKQRVDREDDLFADDESSASPKNVASSNIDSRSHELTKEESEARDIAKEIIEKAFQNPVQTVAELQSAIEMLLKLAEQAGGEYQSHDDLFGPKFPVDVVQQHIVSILNDGVPVFNKEQGTFEFLVCATKAGKLSLKTTKEAPTQVGLTTIPAIITPIVQAFAKDATSVPPALLDLYSSLLNLQSSRVEKYRGQARAAMATFSRELASNFVQVPSSDGKTTVLKAMRVIDGKPSMVEVEEPTIYPHNLWRDGAFKIVFDRPSE